MTKLVLGTKKGLFVLEGEPGSEFELTARAFPGEPVDYATRDPHSGRLFASVTSAFHWPSTPQIRTARTSSRCGRITTGSLPRVASGCTRRATPAPAGPSAVTGSRSAT